MAALCGMLAGLAAMAASGFSLVALWIFVVPHAGPAGAALVVAGVLAVLCLVLLALGPHHRLARSAAAPLRGGHRSIFTVGDRAIQEAQGGHVAGGAGLGTGRRGGVLWRQSIGAAFSSAPALSRSMPLLADQPTQAAVRKNLDPSGGSRRWNALRRGTCAIRHCCFAGPTTVLEFRSCRQAHHRHGRSSTTMAVRSL